MIVTADDYRRCWKNVVRQRLRDGWEAWIAPDRLTHWARITFGPDRGSQPRSEHMQVQAVLPEELDVLDEVLREKVS